jgi:hypothetical protein
MQEKHLTKKKKKEQENCKNYKYESKHRQLPNGTWVLKKKAFNSTSVLSRLSKLQSFLSLQIHHIMHNKIIFHNVALEYHNDLSNMQRDLPLVYT